MKKSALLAAGAFVTASVADTLCIAFGVHGVPNILKPMLMPLLALTMILALYPRPEARGTMRTLGIGLIFHTLGDIFLMYSSTFIVGMASFLVGHCFYLTVICKALGLSFWNVEGESRRFVLLRCCLTFVPAIILCQVVLSFDNALLRYGTMLYGIFLLSVAYYSLIGTLWHRPYFGLVLLGSLFFLFSDGMIALGMFTPYDYPGRSQLIMPTYLLAQALIIYGLSRNSLAEKQPKTVDLP